MNLRFACLLFTVLSLARPVVAQQRPLVTEDPEPIGAGRVLVEGGIDYAHDQHYPVSGLDGNLWRIPTIGVSVGLSSIAELQLDGGLYDRLSVTNRNPNAPLASLVTATGATTHAPEDITIATKVRLLAETMGRPAVGLRFATKLPNASNESGLGLDPTAFYMSLLGAKTVHSVRLVGYLRFGIAVHGRESPERCPDLWGVVCRAMTQQAELVGS